MKKNLKNNAVNTMTILTKGENEMKKNEKMRKLNDRIRTAVFGLAVATAMFAGTKSWNVMAEESENGLTSAFEVGWKSEVLENEVLNEEAEEVPEERLTGPCTKPVPEIIEEEAEEVPEERLTGPCTESVTEIIEEEAEDVHEERLTGTCKKQKRNIYVLYRNGRYQFETKKAKIRKLIRKGWKYVLRKL